MLSNTVQTSSNLSQLEFEYSAPVNNTLANLDNTQNKIHYHNAFTNPNRPAIPSIILTAYKI